MSTKTATETIPQELLDEILPIVEQLIATNYTDDTYHMLSWLNSGYRDAENWVKNPKNNVFWGFRGPFDNRFSGSNHDFHTFLQLGVTQTSSGALKLESGWNEYYKNTTPLHYEGYLHELADSTSTEPISQDLLAKIETKLTEYFGQYAWIPSEKGVLELREKDVPAHLDKELYNALMELDYADPSKWSKTVEFGEPVWSYKVIPAQGYLYDDGWFMYVTVYTGSINKIIIDDGMDYKEYHIN